MKDDSVRNVGEFTNEWFELCIVTEDVIKSLVEQRDPDDNNAEHLRYVAFKKFVAANRPLSQALCRKLYDLGCADVDSSMGGAMMADVVRLPECPIDLLIEASSSNRRNLVRIATGRLGSVHQDSPNNPMNPVGGSELD
jgi:hypothetical protein